MKIKFTLIFALACISILVANSIIKKAPERKTAYKNHLLTMKDGETISMDTLITKAYNHSKLVDKSASGFDDPILKNIDTDSNQVRDLVTYVNSIGGYRNLGYWTISPSQNWETTDDPNTINSPTYSFIAPNKDSYDWTKIDGFSNYYHSLFRNKAARTLLFNQALESVILLCKKYPDDFRQRILKELDALLSFTNTLNSKKVLTDEGVDKLNNYWKGFIYRRIKIDKIPLEEIKTSIVTAQTKLKELGTYEQAKSYFSFDLNNQISILYSLDGFKLYSSSSYMEVKFEEGKKIESVKYIKGSTGDTYEFKGVTKSGNFTEVYDKNLKKIK
jgi:hypothetical protein